MSKSDARRDYQSPEIVARYESERFHSLHGHVYALLHRRGVRKALALLEGSGAVLDVPCGTGRMAPTVTELGLSFIGLDISFAMACHCREHHGRRPRTTGIAVGEIEHLPFADNSIEAVLCLKLFHLIPSADVARALRECGRVASRYVIFDVARGDRWTSAIEWCKRRCMAISTPPRRLSQQAWTDLISAAGLRLLHQRHVFWPVSEAVILTCAKR